MDPLVTIVITSYNYGAHVGDAVRSALTQTHRNLEVLVLDNASTDDSVAVVEGFAGDPRLRLIVQDQNVGIQRNHNDGLRLARGEYVLLLAADDVLLPTAVEDILAYRRAHPDVDMVYASVAVMDRDGKINYYFDHPSFDGAASYVGRNELASLLTRDNNMYLPTMLFPKAMLEELGYMDESLEIVLDYEYGLRIAAAGKKFGFFSKPEALIRFHGENRSGVKNFVKTGKQLREFSILLERYTQPQYHDVLAGYGPLLLAMINRKVAEIQAPFPADFAAMRPELEPLVKRAIASISAVPSISARTLGGEGLISVVLPYSGRMGPLQRALASLAAQDYPHWEAVLVADQTHDPSGLIAAMGLSDRVRVAQTSRTSSGPGRARNLGLMNARGEIVAYLDDDNRFELGYFAALARAFADPVVNVTVGRSRLAVLADNGDAYTVEETELGLAPDGGVSYVSPYLPLDAVAHRRVCVSPAGLLFHPQLMVLEDWEFLIRLNKQYAFTPLETPACVLCAELLLPGGQLFGRRTSAQWSEFATRVQDVYNGHPARSPAENQQRAAYAASLQQVIQRGMNGLGNPIEIVAFVLGLCGATVPPAAAAAT